MRPTPRLVDVEVLQKHHLKILYFWPCSFFFERKRKLSWLKYCNPSYAKVDAHSFQTHSQYLLLLMLLLGSEGQKICDVDVSFLVILDLLVEEGLAWIDDTWIWEPAKSTHLVDCDSLVLLVAIPQPNTLVAAEDIALLQAAVTE